MPTDSLSPRQLRAIVAVADLRNISHAAIELGVSQPTLSRTIAGIEADLDVELFRRDSNGVTPTEAGNRMAVRASEVLQNLDDLEDEMRSLDGSLRGRVCVAMPDTTGHALFLPLLDRFAIAHPKVELRVMGAHPNNVVLALSAGDADIGVISSAHRNEGVDLRPLAIESLHFVGPHRRRAAAAVNLASLANEPLALPAIQPGLRQLIDRAFATRGLRPNVVFEADSQDALLELVKDGRAGSIMSRAGVLRASRRKEVTVQKIENPLIERSLSTAFPRGRTPTRLMRAVEAELRRLVAELAADVGWMPSD